MITRLLHEARRNPAAFARAAFRRALAIPSRGLPRISYGQTQDDFDDRYGVQTAEIERIVATSSPNAKNGTRYEASSEEAYRWCIEHAGVDYRSTTFIDFGSGKGRSLIIAAEYPFADVIGVEYAPDLVKACNRNLAVVRANVPPRLAQPRTVCADAAEWELPDADLLVFMNNPFLPQLQTRVLARLAAHPRRLVLAYRGPNHAGVAASGLFDLVERGPDATKIWRRREAARRAA